MCRYESVWVVKALVTKLVGDLDQGSSRWVPNRLITNHPIPVQNRVDVCAGAIVKRLTVD